MWYQTRRIQVFAFFPFLHFLGFSHAQREALLEASDPLRSLKYSLPSSIVPIKRDGGQLISMDIYVEDYGYYTNLAVGTPPQSIRFILDGTSGNNYVSARSAADKSTAVEPGSYYDPKTSSSFIQSHETFNLTAYDGRKILGSYFADTLTIGNTAVNDLNIGLVNNTSINSLGLGNIGVDIASANYSNLLSFLYAVKTINCMAYSLWLDGPESSNGQLVVGGVDMGKFQGTLETIPTALQASQVTSFIIPMTSFGFLDGPVLLTEPTQVELSTSTNLVYLPIDVISSLATKLGFAGKTNTLSYLTKACLDIDNSTSFYIVLGATRITVPIVDLLEYDDTSDDGKDFCHLRIFTENGPPYPIGLTFLKQMYTVFDLSNNQVSIAAIDSNSSVSNITAIPPGGVAGLSRMSPSQSIMSNNTTPQSTSLDGANSSIGPQSTSTLSTSSGTGPQTTSTDSSSSTAGASGETSVGTRIGIVAGATAGGVLCLCAAGYSVFWLRGKYTVASNFFSKRSRTSWTSKVELSASSGKVELGSFAGPHFTEIATSDRGWTVGELAASERREGYELLEYSYIPGPERLNLRRK